MTTSGEPLRLVDPATETPPPNTRLVRVGRRTVLAARPNPRQFGHLAIEILYALAYARLVDVPVYLHRPRDVVNDPVFEVEADGVEIVQSGTQRRLVERALAAAERADARRRWRARVRSELASEATAALRHQVDVRPGLPPRVRKAALQRAKQIKYGLKDAAAPAAGYNRRRLVAEPLATRLRPDAEERGRAAAAAVGIAEDTRLVCVHVRERGYKLGREMQDKGVGAWDDSVRNARIPTHFAAFDYLVAHGYRIVRMGDPTMTPVRREGVIDLATAPAREPLLELYCLFRSEFLLCGESGPLSVSYLTNTPLLTVNATDPIGAFPIREDGVYLLKTVVDRATDCELAAADLLDLERLPALREPTRHRHVQNTPEEIVGAVQEMLELLERKTPETPEQTRYRELVADVASSAVHFQYVRKHGPDRGYMGVGRLARSAAARAFAGSDDAVAARAAAPA